MVRLVLAFSPGYIHPDEHFQSPEVAAAWVFDFQALHIPWEYAREDGYRSVLWPYVEAVESCAATGCCFVSPWWNEVDACVLLSVPVLTVAIHLLWQPYILGSALRSAVQASVALRSVGLTRGRPHACSPLPVACVLVWWGY